jgi:hypothetical protein
VGSLLDRRRAPRTSSIDPERGVTSTLPNEVGTNLPSHRDSAGHVWQMRTAIRQWYAAVRLGTHGDLRRRGFTRVTEGGASTRDAAVMLALRDTALTPVLRPSHPLTHRPTSTAPAARLPLLLAMLMPIAALIPFDCCGDLPAATRTYQRKRTSTRYLQRVDTFEMQLQSCLHPSHGPAMWRQRWSRRTQTNYDTTRYNTI